MANLRIKVELIESAIPFPYFPPTKRFKGFNGSLLYIAWELRDDAMLIGALREKVGRIEVITYKHFTLLRYKREVSILLVRTKANTCRLLILEPLKGASAELLVRLRGQREDLRLCETGETALAEDRERDRCFAEALLVGLLRNK